MEQYNTLLRDILQNGSVRGDRTGVGTTAVFGRQLRFDLSSSFPAITTKKLAWRAVVGELLWFLEGSGDERRLAEITHGTREGVATIWTPNSLAPYWKNRAKFLGDLGRVYGVQWRKWRKLIDRGVGSFKDEFGTSYRRTGGVQVVEVDQIKNLVNDLKRDPNSRRHIISAWNPGELDDMALPPCHVMAQFWINDGKLSCHMYQRSVDVFLGLPFNIASYALLTCMLAHVTGYTPGELVISTGDTHIYSNHLPQVKEQLLREEYPAPTLWLNPEIKDIFSFKLDDIQLVGYKCHDQLKATMAV